MAFRGPEAPHTPPAAAQEADQRLHQRRRAALEAPRRADARQVPHEQPEIDAADLDEQPPDDGGSTLRCQLGILMVFHGSVERFK